VSLKEAGGEALQGRALLRAARRAFRFTVAAELNIVALAGFRYFRVGEVLRRYKLMFWMAVHSG
jgi:hypothetical protein